MANLKLFWDTNPGITDFFISYKLVSDPSYTTTPLIYSNQYTLTGLNPCVPYDIKIGANCASGAGIVNGPTIITIQDGTCGAKFYIQMNNQTTGDLYKITGLGNADGGSYTYSPIISGGAGQSNSFLLAPLWDSNNFSVNVTNTTGLYHQFYLKVYLNGSALSNLIFNSSGTPSTILSTGILYFTTPTLVNNDSLIVNLYVV